MGFLIAFLILWGILSALAILGLAAVPTTKPASNGDLLIAIVICAVIAAILVLLASGLINLVF